MTFHNGFRIAFSALSLCLILWAAYSLRNGGSEDGAASAPLIVEEDNVKEDIVTLGRSVIVTGRVKAGILALGGDVIVDGVVEGDVATMGGSVIQRDGYIGGDVIVIGGTYQHTRNEALRDPNKQTIIYAGNEEWFRKLFQNPAREILMPRWDRYFIGQRIFAAFFSFILSLIVVTLIPGQVTRASEQLTKNYLRVGSIGLVGMVVISLSILLLSQVLPTMLWLLISIIVGMSGIAALIFGSVTIYFLVGRWLQQNMFGLQSSSHSVALLMGVLLWVILRSLPVVNVILFLAMLIVSAGLVFTAGWREQPGDSWGERDA